MAHILVTGGAGFIGSHTCIALLEAGHRLQILDNFTNSSPISLQRVAVLANVALGGEKLKIVRGDIRNTECLEKIFQKNSDQGIQIEAVIHFAGLKAVRESVENPLRYWDVNVSGTRNLLDTMNNHNCQSLVFSSSATLYGNTKINPIPESAPIQPINPYGHSKAAVEQMLNDLVKSEPKKWRIACLRYFNPVGAHPSGQIGEDPLGIPNNLFPLISQVAIGRRDYLQVFGEDWPTIDGSGVRDYIHVMDLAEGHRAALECLMAEDPQLLSLNLGSGKGTSVFEMVRAFETASGRPIPCRVANRRPGDAAITVADPSRAAALLRWQTQRDLHDMCRDGWAWQKANPMGYR